MDAEVKEFLNESGEYCEDTNCECCVGDNGE